MSKNPVHIYRALLRECTYLPDPNSRAFIKGWVQDSFRRYLPRDPSGPQCKPIDVPPKRESVVLRKARQLAYTLRRANEGYPTSFEKVLRWTYARTGKRRRVLMTTLTAQEPSDSELQKAVNVDSPKFTRDWKPPPILQVLLHNQQQVQNLLPWQNKKIRARGADIPEKNIWGRPMPECRIRNKQKEWYAKNLDLIQLPLPPKEYRQIKAYATGEQKLEVKSRRPHASVLVYSSPEHQETGLLHEPGMVQRVKERPHQLTDRMLRRHMQRLLMHVPYVQRPLNQPDVPIAVKWERLNEGKLKVEETNEAQANALFG